MRLSSIVNQILNETILNESKPRISAEAWETQFFLSLENEWEQSLTPLSADSKLRLKLVFQFAQKYLAFHYRYRRRFQDQSSFDLFDTSELVWTKIDDEHRHSPIEWIGFVPLYPNGNLGDFTVIHYGTSSRVQVEPIELFARVLRLKPLGFYLIHNHPSGDLTPSSFDHQLTERVKMASDAIGLNFFGHGIVSSVGETWICDISLTDDSRANRKLTPRFNPSTSAGARQSTRYGSAHDHASQKLRAPSGAFNREPQKGLKG
jgi:DNA repair protein RadC